MQKILLLIVLAAAAVFAYLQWFAKPAYSIPTIEQNPIPKHEFYLLWRETALTLCDGNEPGPTTLTPPKCREYVTNKHERCVTQVGAQTPPTISSKAESKRLARPYLDCVIPGHFCNGVEVRTPDEALRHCSS
ncbi:hypothetical protein IEQ11_25660 [Lysobacter capsici]|uniref:hypothetical protein n=1 Tax=Lysobacter capsici TaxID=435897 RepID=UPI001782D0C2|nr:hypothetical protein [Lysobacter capsici]UOF15051.1 hypothetical protein IEQ11_25660 [Lysobacter capsici]